MPSKYPINTVRGVVTSSGVTDFYAGTLIVEGGVQDVLESVGGILVDSSNTIIQGAADIVAKLRYKGVDTETIDNVMATYYSQTTGTAPSYDVPVDPTTSPAEEGVDSTLSRSDHKHHVSLATNVDDGFMSAGDKDRFDQLVSIQNNGSPIAGVFQTINFIGSWSPTDAGGGQLNLGFSAPPAVFADSEGSPIGPPFGPFSTLDFVGGGVFLTSPGGGVAQVHVPDQSTAIGIPAFFIQGQTTDATPTALISVGVNPNQGFIFETRIVGTRDDGSEMYSAILSGSFRHPGAGSVTQVSTTSFLS